MLCRTKVFLLLLLLLLLSSCHQAGSVEDLHICKRSEEITGWARTCPSERNDEVLKFCLLIIEFESRSASQWSLVTWHAHTFVYCYVSFVPICLKVGKCQMLIIRVEARDALLLSRCLRRRKETTRSRVAQKRIQTNVGCRDARRLVFRLGPEKLEYIHMSHTRCVKCALSSTL